MSEIRPPTGLAVLRYPPVAKRHPVHAWAIRTLRALLRMLGDDDGIIRGASAARIWHEVEHGTPNTPERQATFARVREMEAGGGRARDQNQGAQR